MSNYLSRVLEGATPSAADWNEYLVAFHRAHRDGTGTIMSAMRTPDGKTSYEVLASQIRELAPGAHDILDVGCGDGSLLALLHSMYGPEVMLKGIDLSASDLERARMRLPTATFIQGDAAEVDMGRKSQDVVASHLAFMAMPQTRVVFAHIRAALRERGLLACVVEDPLADDALLKLMTRAVAAVRERFPRFTPVVPGREPIEHDDALRTMLSETGFSSVEIEHFYVAARLAEDELWNFVALAYPFGLLDDRVLRELRTAIAPEIAAIARAGGEVTLALRLVVARA